MASHPPPVALIRQAELNLGFNSAQVLNQRRPRRSSLIWRQEIEGLLQCRRRVEIAAAYETLSTPLSSPFYPILRPVWVLNLRFVLYALKSADSIL